MKPNEFKKLIDRFYAGETSEKEEALLKELLEHSHEKEFADVKQHLLSMLELESEVRLDTAFDERIMQQISHQEKPLPKRSILNYQLSGVAAAILMLLAIWWGTELFNTQPVYGTITDPKIAFNETQKVLDSIAIKMNKVIKPVKKSVKEIDNNISKTDKVKEINNTINKMKKLEDLERVNELFRSFNKVSVTYGSS